MPVLSLAQQGDQFFTTLAQQLRLSAMGRRFRSLAGSNQNGATANECAYQSGECGDDQLHQRKRLRGAHISSLEMRAKLNKPTASLLLVAAARF
jgi:hypothetical protein